MRFFPAIALGSLLALSNVGCIKSMLTNGQIEATRNGSKAFDTIGDYELARGAAQAGLVQFEGMHRLAPDNDDALFLLVSGWVGYGFAFPEDDMEAALDKGDETLAEYHKGRAKMAYDRAIFYGLELLSHRSDGLAAARKNEETMKKWLKENFTSREDAEALLWTGYGWLAKTNLLKAQPEVVAELFVGVAMVERSVELAPELMHYSGMGGLGAYHARNAVAELDEAKKLFEAALAKTQHKSLLVQVTYAHSYACVKADRALYEKLLNEVLAADDPDPDQRLNNAVAKRRARRYIQKSYMSDCGMDLSTPPSKK